MRLSDFCCSCLLAALLLVWTPVVHDAGAKTYGDLYNVRFVEALDGRSLVVDIAGVHPLVGDHVRVRIRGILVPERTGHCERERHLADQARDLVDFFLRKAKKITLRDVSRDRVFRIRAVILADGVDIRPVLVNKGLAQWEHGAGGSRDWCK